MQALSNLARGVKRFEVPAVVAEVPQRDIDREMRVKQHLQAANIPHRYRFASLLTCDPKATRYAERVASSKPQNLVITGPAKAGKTHTACAVLKQVITTGGQSGLFIPTSDLMSEIKRSYNRKVDEDSIVFRYASKRILVLDDFGKEQFTAWSMSIIWRILNRRYNAMRPTVITTQYTVQQLGDCMVQGGADAQMVQAIVRRILDPLDPLDEGSGAEVIHAKAAGLSA